MACHFLNFLSRFPKESGIFQYILHKNYRHFFFGRLPRLNISSFLELWRFMDLKISTRHQPQTTKAEIQIPMIPIQTVFLQQINQPSFPFHHFILTSSHRFLPVNVVFVIKKFRFWKKNGGVCFFFKKIVRKEKQNISQKIPRWTNGFVLPMINLLVRFSICEVKPICQAQFRVRACGSSERFWGWKPATKNAKSEGMEIHDIYIYLYIHM